MKTITATELNTHLNDYLKLARAEEIVIKLDDGNLLRLGSVDPEDLLDESFESDPRFMEMIEARRLSYQQRGGIPLEAVRNSLLPERNASGRQIHEEGLSYSTGAESSEDSAKDNHAEED